MALKCTPMPTASNLEDPGAVPMDLVTIADLRFYLTLKAYT